MSRNRLSLLIAFVAMAVVAVGGFFLAVQPQLALAAAAGDQRESVEQTNATSRAELTRLRDQSAELPSMQEQLSQLSASIPDSSDLSSFIADLNSVATASGMQISSYTTSDAVAYAPAAAAAGSTAATSSATASASPSPSPSASTAPASTPTAPAAPSAVTNGAITGQNFSVIPVTVAVDGTFDQALTFVNGIQHGSRLFLVTNVSSAEKSGEDGTASNQSTWTFGGSIYVLADPAATPAATPSATPAAG